MIDHISSVTKTFDHIGIGTDENFSKIPVLESALQDLYGDEVAQQILWKNALRVLKQGWG